MEVLLYFALLILWSAAIAYLLLFKIAPSIVSSAHEAHEHEGHAAPAPHHPPARRAAVPEPRQRYSAHEGFRSFQRGEDLTVDDIVKGLSRE